MSFVGSQYFLPKVTPLYFESKLDSNSTLHYIAASFTFDSILASYLTK